MRAIKTFITFSGSIAILSFLIFLNASCSKQSASLSAEQSVKADSIENSFSTNPKVAAAQKLIEKSPDLPAGYNQLASAYIHLARENGDFRLNQTAVNAVDKALEVDSQNEDAQKLHASLLLTFHRFPDALEAGENLRQKYPQDAFVYGVLTDANVELGNYDEAVESVQKMVDLRPNMESYARVSYVRSLYGDTEGAIQAMTTAANIADPSDKEGRAWCIVHLGNEYFKAGRYKEAESAYDIALKTLPDYHFALAGKGLARMANGDYENAIKFLEQAQNRIPLTETVIALGDLYKKTGNAEKADEQYKLVEIVEQKLNLTADQRRLALFWADHDMKLDEALEIAARMHGIQNDVLTDDIYAWCLYKKGRFDEAKAAMSEALRIKDKDARTFYHAGMIEKALGNKKEAKQFLQKALQTNPAFDLLQADVAKSALQELQ
ncbi:MAG: tetratricopeptide repeat protein [Pyrinomonadaceae bacterium]